MVVQLLRWCSPCQQAHLPEVCRGHVQARPDLASPGKFVPQGGGPHPSPRVGALSGEIYLGRLPRPLLEREKPGAQILSHLSVCGVGT